MSEPQNIRLTLEYDGTQYSGWQKQPRSPTIQGELEKAIHKFSGLYPTIYAAGRTDAGVHAIGQVVNFHLEKNIDPWKICRAVNNFLPRDITAHRSERVPKEFNSRFDSISKRYRYRIYQGPQPAALDRNHSWWLMQDLDTHRMREAAEALTGIHDFNAFRSVHCDAVHAKREIFSIDVDARPRPPFGQFLDLTFHANAFCRHMCRILAGTITEVGLGKRTLLDIEKALQSKTREDGGQTAPPGGLTLLQVFYPEVER